MKTSSDIADQLRRKNLRATSKRVELLSLISEEKNAVPYSFIQKNLGDFDRVTLYRTLQALVDHGVLHKALKDSDDTFYAMCSNDCSASSHHHNHVHFKCSKCGEVTCQKAKGSFEISIPGFQVDDFEVIVKGLCEGCVKG